MGDSKRRWWRKKRWRAVAIVWLPLPLLCWPFLLGPASYAASRGWIPAAAYELFKAPVAPVLNSPRCRPLREASRWDQWHLWWQAKANPRLFGPVYERIYGDDRAR